MSGIPPQQPSGPPPNQGPPNQGPPNQGPPNQGPGQPARKRKGPPLVVKIVAGVVGFIVLAGLALGGWILFRPLNQADYSQAAAETEEAGRIWELLDMTFQNMLQTPGKDEAKLDSQVEVLTAKIDQFDTELSDIENARVIGKDDEAEAVYQTARDQGDDYVAWLRQYAASMKPLAMMQVACDQMDSDVYFQFEETDTAKIFDEAVDDCEAAARSAVEEAPQKARAEARIAYIDALREELKRFLAETAKGDASSAASQKKVLKIQNTFTKANKAAVTGTANDSQQQSEEMLAALSALFTHLDDQSN